MNVVVYFAQMLQIFAQIMANFSALGMRPHPHAVHLCGLQSSLNICDDYAANHEIAYNCNKTSGVSFSPKIINNLLRRMFSKWCACRLQFSDQVIYLGVLLNAALKTDSDIQRQVKSLYSAANKLRGALAQCSTLGYLETLNIPG